MQNLSKAAKTDITKAATDSILDNILSPDDVKALSKKQLNKLCAEIRQELVDTIAETGGHLSSNLGVVELTIALHREFTSPVDQIVWDVGHQCYVHKLLTGRAGRFNTLRQENGITGFPNAKESIHDNFTTGHSSTSISTANGMAKAKAMLQQDGHVIAVIGDGALTGGLAYEGLSNAGRSKDRLIVVLNDNGMSISQNVGFVARHLATLRAKPFYVRVKNAFSNLISSIPIIGKRLRNRAGYVKSGIKKMVYKQSSFFEEMGFNYIGPLDGHDIDELSKAFKSAKSLNKPALIHVATVKGKGIEFAENNPAAYHGVSGFNISNGAIKPSSKSYSSVFGEQMCNLASSDSRICAITAAMRVGTGLDGFGEMYPKRFFDVGIAEGHAVTFASGLAYNSAIPVFAVYSTFLQRSYDQIINDVAISGQHVVFAVDRAGITGEDGETHQGIFDVPFLNTIPNMTIYSPSNYTELQINLRQAVYEENAMVAVRYPRGAQPENLQEYKPDYKHFTYFESKQSNVLLVTYGRLFSHALKASKKLERLGVKISVLKLTKIKPVEQKCIDIIKKYNNVYFFEESSRAGGTGEYIGGILQKQQYNGQYDLHAIDGFVPVCTPESAIEKLGLDYKAMTSIILKDVNTN